MRIRNQLITLLILAAASAGIGFFVTARGHHALEVGVTPANAAVAKSSDSGDGIQTAQDAAKAIANMFPNGGGPTADALASTHSVLHFPGNAAPSVAGLDVYATSLPGGGPCVAYGGAAACSKTNPDQSTPVLGLTYDQDSDTSGVPFVMVGLIAPSVKAVTFTCDGQTIDGTISHNLVTFTAPSPSIPAEQCSQTVTFANGTTSSPVTL